MNKRQKEKLQIVSFGADGSNHKSFIINYQQKHKTTNPRPNQCLRGMQRPET